MVKDLIRKFSLYSIVIIALFGIVLNLVLSYKIEEIVIERTKITLVDWVETSAKNFLRKDMFENSDPDKNKEIFDMFYNNLKTKEIERIKIFNANRTIIYSDKNDLVGQNFLDNEELDKALKGSVEVEINRKLEKDENIYERRNYSGLMEIYVPLRSGSGEVYGVAELYQVLDNVDQVIFEFQATIAILSFLGLVVLYISLIWIMKSASEIIIKQNIALLNTNEEIKQIDKMKNEFINSMSHELRTPLNAVIGFSDLLKLKDTGELNERQKRYVDNISKSGQHLLAIVSDILDMIMIEAGKLELVVSKIPLNLTIDENLERVRSNAEKNNVQINKEIDPELEFIDVDKDKFSQILSNLLDNAIKFSKKNGGIVNIIARKAGDKMQFSISDNGIGIKEENIGKLFSVFVQLDTGISRKYGGTGLGLTIAKKLIELHGGRIWAKSKYGEGSTFTFELPHIQKKEARLND